MTEEYGPDGEIEEVWEGPEAGPEWGSWTTLTITGHGHAEPKRDWRERGVTPPRGFHRYGESRRADAAGRPGQEQAHD